MDKNRVIVVAGGELHLSELDIIQADDIVITADAGMVPLLEKGILPHLAVGDFDTTNDIYVKKMEQKGISIQKLSIHKEETDTHHAIRKALTFHPQEIVILGALGGSRLDHMLGNVGLLEWLMDHGVHGVLMHRSNRIRLLKGPVTWSMYQSAYSYVSLIPVTGKVTGITTEGFLYPLRQETLYRGLTQGISNKLKEERGTIDIEEGKCLVIESSDG